MHCYKRGKSNSVAEYCWYFEERKLQLDAELHLLSRQLLYKTSFKPKVLFLGEGQRAGGNVPPVKPASLLLLMLIENTSVIDGAGKGFFPLVWR